MYCAAQFYEFDLTSFIQTEKAAGHNTISLRLVSTQATGTDDPGKNRVQQCVSAKAVN